MKHFPPEQCVSGKTALFNDVDLTTGKTISAMFRLYY